MLGSIKDFDYGDGVGTIHPDDDRGDVRFVSSAVVNGRRLRPSQRVEFALVYGPKGPEAVEIRSV